MDKLLLADLLSVAQAEGFKGDAQDPKAVKSYLLGLPEPIETLTKAGKDFDVKSWEPEAPKTGRKASVPASAPKGGLDEFPADMAEKVKSQVLGDLLKSGAIKLDRPGDPTRSEVTNVKSVQERMYDIKVKQGTARFSSFGEAKCFQHFIGSKMAEIVGDRAAAASHDASYKSMSEKVYGKAYSTGSATQGSAIVPEVFIPDLIKNVLEYGVARRLSRVRQMPEKKIIIPRSTGNLTMYYPDENTAGTESTGTYNNITLDAKTGVVLTKASREILQDTGIDFVEDLMDDIARAIALAEDNAMLIGDGSATYAGMTGFERKYGVTATDGGYVVVGGADTTAHTAAQLNTAIGRLPQYARANAVWTCTPQIKVEIFDRLADSTPGGLTLGELTGFGLVQRWKGIPIIENNVMSSVLVASTTNRPGFTAGDQIDVLLGDFSRAASFGERLGLEIMQSTERGFDTNSVWFRGVVRHDVNVHDVGTSTAAGPVVSFWQT